MAKKKKTQLKPVARGFATTSVPKKAVPVEEDAEASSVNGNLEEEILKTDNGPTSSTAPAEAQTDEFDPNKVEEQSLQNLVDRLQSTTEKDIVRTVKVYQSMPRATLYSGSSSRLSKWIDDFQKYFHA
jgi:ATP-dependent RNA helicase DHX29